ncbi:MAG: ImmA/IrrE family metallo-endopeptidase [Cyanobacteria bacterium P01_A01_bin.3]
MTEVRTMNSLYPKLQAAGVPKQYVKQYVLPDWWNSELDADPEALVTAASYLATRLNLEFISLVQNDSELKFCPNNQIKYKKSEGNQPHQLLVPRAIASRLGEWAAHACPVPYNSIVNLSAREIRKAILHSDATVNLNSLLQFCWNHGVPVIHLTKYPAGNRKFDGVVLKVGGRHVIVISVDHTSPSKISFILAHEIGHICLNHIRENDEYLDQSIELDSDSDSEEERQANFFATEVLHGNPEPRYQILRPHNLDTFLFEARSFGDSHIDPGAFLWSYAWNANKTQKRNYYPLVNNVLKILEEGKDARRIINTYFENSIVWDKLSSERQDYLKEMVSVGT